MQAAEARAAMRAAEEATRKALEAQAAAQEALFQWESATAEEAAETEAANAQARDHVVEFEAIEPYAEPMDEVTEVPIARTPMQGLEIRWEPDMPPMPVAPPMAYAGYEEAGAESEPELWSSDAYEMEQALQPVEPPQAIPANLIEFPREVVATRRMRPRNYGVDPNATGELFGQLSIFEVDPTTISTVVEARPETSETAREWNGPEWSKIQLDAEPLDEKDEETGQVALEAALELAPMHQRLLAALVDVSLVAGAACGAVYWAAGHLHAMPSMRFAELGALGLLMAIGAAYYALFLIFAGMTPGMRYARLRLRDFENAPPSQMQMRGRVLAMVVSTLPVGLGLMWALFDDEGLSWHDRLSKTYLQAY